MASMSTMPNDSPPREGAHSTWQRADVPPVRRHPHAPTTAPAGTPTPAPVAPVSRDRRPPPTVWPAVLHRLADGRRRRRAPRDPCAARDARRRARWDRPWATVRPTPPGRAPRRCPRSRNPRPTRPPPWRAPRATPRSARRGGRRPSAPTDRGAGRPSTAPGPVEGADQRLRAQNQTRVPGPGGQRLVQVHDVDPAPTQCAHGPAGGDGVEGDRGHRTVGGHRQRPAQSTTSPDERPGTSTGPSAGARTRAS